MFEVHQPYRLDREIISKLLEKSLKGRLEHEDLEDAIFDSGLNKLVMERAVNKCYLPANNIILENINKYKDLPRKFKVSYSISGVFLEQAQRWAPRIIDSFSKLVETGFVELVEQTYYHSMAALMPLPDFEELREQIYEHRRIIKELFNVEPVSIENTEFTFNNDIACLFHKLGYRVVLTEGVDWVLGWRSSNYVYRAYGCDIKVLVRNYRLSDDVGFRFSDRKWDQYPLTADKYASWLSNTPGDVLFIAMDYETFGEHHWPETGIHEFLRWLPGEILKYSNLGFSTPSEVVEKYPARDVIDVPPWSTISWADERDISAWLGNNMQKHAFTVLLSLRPYVKALDNPTITKLWKLLTISDHLYYMATKFGSIEEVHSYFSPYKNASTAYALFMQAVSILSYLVSLEIMNKRGTVLSKLRVSSDKAFHFYRAWGEYTGLSAHSISEFIDLLDKVPLDSLNYHLNKGDIQLWLKNTFFLEDLVIEIDNLLKVRHDIEFIKDELKKTLKQFLNRI